MTYDTWYWLACEHARDDWHWWGIQRTDAEVEAEADRLRWQAQQQKGDAP